MRTTMPPLRKDNPKTSNIKTGLSAEKLLESGNTYKTTPRGMGLNGMGLKKGGIQIKSSHKGLLHKNLGIAKDKPIESKILNRATHSKNAAVHKRAVFAKNAKKWNHT